MKARNIHRILVITSVFVSFIVYLCVSLVNITPFLLIITLCATAAALEGLANRNYTAVKLYTQKAE